MPETSQLEPAATPERLRQIAARHQVCYEVWPECSVAGGRKIQIGFEVQLCGTNSHIAAQGEHQIVPGCEYCLETYEELREIAEWILPHDEQPSRYEITGFDRALHVAPPLRHSRAEVLLSIHILHRSDFNRDVDDCENQCLKEMRAKLGQLRVLEGKWMPPEESGPERK